MRPAPFTPSIRHLIDEPQIAGPGFINFKLKPAAKLGIVQRILAEGENFGKAKSANKEKVQVEFVSANPTGPLHVGHGRQAALGDAIAALLESQGHAVTREFYYNDAGAQIDKLTLVGAGARQGPQARPAGLAGGRLCRRVHRGHRTEKFRPRTISMPIRKSRGRLPAKGTGRRPAGVRRQVRRLLPRVEPLHRGQGREDRERR